MDFWHIFFTPWMYSVVLILSLAGLAFCDWRWRLVFWESMTSARAAATTIGSMVAGFIIWDVAGIVIGIFFTNTRYTLGLHIVSANLPIEEFLFLGLLSYIILLLWFGAQRWLTHPKTSQKLAHKKAGKSA